MNAADFIALVLTWTLRSSLLLLVGLALPTLARLGPPALRLRYWQVLLGFALLAPTVGGATLQPLLGGAEAVTARWMETLTVSAARSAEAMSPWIIGAALLLTGTLARLFWIAGGLLALARRTRRATPYSPAPELAGIDLPDKLRLLLSEDIAGPVTFGVLRPVILLPARFPSLPLATQRGVLCHELEHVRRGDWLSILFEEALRALLWFHPGVWLVLARIELAREQVVDDAVVRQTGQRRAYLEALWSLACQPGLAAPSLPFLNHGHLRARVAQLTQEVRMSRSKALVVCSAFAFLLVLTEVGGASLLPLPADASQKAGKETVKALEMSENIVPPKRISGPAPVYPQIAKDEKIEGVTVIRAIIGADGKVSQPQVVGSAGHADLDQAAVDAVSQWSFQPATLDGKAVDVYYKLTIRFQLD